MGLTLWYSRYTVILLRLPPSASLLLVLSPPFLFGNSSPFPFTLYEAGAEINLFYNCYAILIIFLYSKSAMSRSQQSWGLVPEGGFSFAGNMVWEPETVTGDQWILGKADGGERGA
jgi:hypothetical protein